MNILFTFFSLLVFSFIATGCFSTGEEWTTSTVEEVNDTRTRFTRTKVGTTETLKATKEEAEKRREAALSNIDIHEILRKVDTHFKKNESILSNYIQTLIQSDLFNLDFCPVIFFHEHEPFPEFHNSYPFTFKHSDDYEQKNGSFQTLELSFVTVEHAFQARQFFQDCGIFGSFTASGDLSQYIGLAGLAKVMSAGDRAFERNKQPSAKFGAIDLSLDNSGWLAKRNTVMFKILLSKFASGNEMENL